MYRKLKAIFGARLCNLCRKTLPVHCTPIYFDTMCQVTKLLIVDKITAHCTVGFWCHAIHKIFLQRFDTKPKAGFEIWIEFSRITI